MALLYIPSVPFLPLVLPERSHDFPGNAMVRWPLVPSNQIWDVGCVAYVKDASFIYFKGDRNPSFSLHLHIQEFFCQIWTQDNLIHLLWHFITTFEICQFLVTPGPFDYFWQNWVSSENQFFLDEEATTRQCTPGILGGQVPGLYDGTIFGGATHLGGPVGHQK